MFSYKRHRSGSLWVCVEFSFDLFVRGETTSALYSPSESRLAVRILMELGLYFNTR